MSAFSALTLTLFPSLKLGKPPRCCSSSSVLELRARPRPSCSLLLCTAEACVQKNLEEDIYLGICYHKQGIDQKIEFQSFSHIGLLPCILHVDPTVVGHSRASQYSITLMSCALPSCRDIRHNVATDCVYKETLPQSENSVIPWCWKYCIEIKRLHRGADCKQGPQGLKRPEQDPALY